MDSLSYVRDSIGDVESAKYGRAGNPVPRFNRSRAGRVLGLDAGLQIASISHSDGIQILPSGCKRRRYTDADTTTAYPSKRLKAGSEDTHGEAGQDFIYVDLNRKDKKKERDYSEYLGHTFAGSNENSSSAKEVEDDADEEITSDEEGVIIQDELKERLKALESILRSNPSDVTSWLSLIALQKDLLDQSQKVHQDVEPHIKKRQGDLSLNERTILAEVQFAVVNRAMREHPSNASSLPLIKAKINLAASSGAWQRQRIDREWKQVISSTTDWQVAVDLWHAYLKWDLEDNDAFVLGDNLHRFAEAVRDFIKYYFDEKQSQVRAHKEIVMIDLFKRIVHMILDAGFVERARGLIQAQIELSSHLLTFASELTQEYFDSSCQQLEDYWDLQEYRIGEDGYKTWTQFREETTRLDGNGMQVNSKESKSMTFGPVPSGLNSADPVIRWLSLEKARAALRMMPAKCNDEADWPTGELEVDPFSFIFYHDIEPFLIPVATSKGFESLVKLLLASFGVCEMSDSRQLINSDTFWPSHLARGIQGCQLELIDGLLMPSPRRSALSQPFQMPVKQWPIQVRDMYSVQSGQIPTWFAAWGTNSVQRDGIDVARCIFEQISKPSTSIRLAHLGLVELTQKYKLTTRLAKKLLGDDCENVEIWRAYAILERNNNKMDTARTVYKSLLGAKGTLSLTSVWTDWANLEWEQGHHQEAIAILIKAATVRFNVIDQSSLTRLSIASPTDILRTRKALLTLASQTCNEDVIYSAALFSYLSESKETAFPCAMKVFDDSMTSNLATESLERIAMNHCRFIWQHIDGNPQMQRSKIYLPKTIREVLRRYVLQFPHNTAFVALLAAFEMTTKVENVLRNELEKRMQLLGKEAKEEDWLVYIYCELHMNVHSINEEAVRRLLERAVDADSTSNSSVLWQMYLRFEVQIAQRFNNLTREARDKWEKETEKSDTIKENLKRDEKRSKAASMRGKTVLYRAIQKVPYCKALYLTAFESPLRQVFKNDELLQLSHLMQDKDVRFFINLEAFLQPRDESDGSP